MRRCHVALLLALVLTFAAGHATANDANPILFSYFVGNGEDGLHLAWSEDGHTFEPLNDGRPLLKPRVGRHKLMRDPSIARGPDGQFHMVWTTGWEGNTIGYARSGDLVHWSKQRAIRPFRDSDGVKNCWAPEVYYDHASSQFVVVWASTIEDRFPETLDDGHDSYNHRLYAFTTTDFEDIGEAELFHEPGFQVIDGAIFRPADRYAMVVKDETLKPEPAKHLFLTFADSATGSWSEPTEPITGDYWAEGPTPLKVGEWWYIYFDKYRKGRFGAVRSRDLQRWQDVSGRISMPEKARHGTAFRTPREVFRKLRNLSGNRDYPGRTGEKQR